MSSIPAVPGIALGNIIQPQFIEHLKKLEEAQKPQSLANEKYNELAKSNYKIGMIYKQMVNLGLDEESLEDIAKEQRSLKDEMLNAAIGLIDATIESQDKVMEVQMKAGQTEVTVNAESPVDYKTSQVEPFPLAIDSLEFDVQYFRNERNDDNNASHQKQVNKSVSSAYRNGHEHSSSGSSYTGTSASVAQISQHEIEGTVVITAKCLHKQADIIEPFVLDPRKAVLSWNATFPDDKISTDAETMIQLAIGATEKDRENKMRVLSGCTKASSFVGYVHLFKSEGSSSSQISESTASAVQSAHKRGDFSNHCQGHYGSTKSDAETIGKMLSTTELRNSCNFQVEGVIPSIKSNSIKTTLKSMKPSPKEVMEKLGAMQNASDSAVNNQTASFGGDGMKGATFVNMESSNLASTVLPIAERVSDNQVIDMNSMMDAFTDYVDKAIAGDCGVPINFFFKEITKEMIAKAYCRTFYPNGAVSFKDRSAGAIGIEQK